MRRIVVITGAEAGVGRAAAREFARNGCDVDLLSRNPDRLECAATELRNFGVRALPIPTDVADAKAVDARHNGLNTSWVRSTSGERDHGDCLRARSQFV